MGLSDKDIVALSGGHTLVIVSSHSALYPYTTVSPSSNERKFLVLGDKGKSSSREIRISRRVDKGSSQIRQLLLCVMVISLSSSSHQAA